MPHIKDAWTVSKQAARHYGCSAITRFIKLLYLRIVYGYKIQEARKRSLLKPGVRVTLKTAWSGNRYAKYTHFLNPPEHIGETDDKIKFAKSCLTENLSGPPICGIFNPGGEYHGLNENTQSGLTWEQFLDSHVCDEFVVKPQFGYGGNLVYLFRKRNGQVENSQFGSMTPTEFHEKLKEIYTVCPALIQRRVYNHPALKEQFKVDTLTTFRLILIRDGPGTDRIMYAHMKFPGVGREIDNFNSGVHGGIQAEMNFETGTIESPNISGVDQFGFETITHHPETGVLLKGAKIPFWKETCELALKASRAMKNMSSVGWDIAITQDGPSLIEGNSAWGFPNTEKNVHHIQTELVKVCGKL